MVVHSSILVSEAYGKVFKKDSFILCFDCSH